MNFQLQNILIFFVFFKHIVRISNVYLKIIDDQWTFNIFISLFEQLMKNLVLNIQVLIL